MAQSRHTRITYGLELWRALMNGVLETASTTFLLLIAVRWFGAGALAKGLVAAGSSIGLLVSPLVVWHVSRRGWRPAQAAASVALMGACLFALMALLPLGPVFIVGSVLGMTAMAGTIPLMTQIYQNNYPAAERGKLFSRTVAVRIAAATAFSYLAGRWLDARLDHFPWLLLMFAVAFGVTAWCLRRMPSRPLSDEGGRHPWRAWRYVREDRLFRQTLAAWMLMGWANLMMWPLRVEYLANERFGLQLPVLTIALLVGVIPNAVRLVMSPLWGWLFDRMNFFTLRVVLNLGFALGIVAFFTGHSLPSLVVGAVVFGVANAGGDVAWSLWVTKLAPPARVADYMSVHTFLTGVRGVLAPLSAYALATPDNLGWLAAGCAGLILVASAMLIPEIKVDRERRRGTALVEEVSE
ncbi:MFS transporter [Fontisphaera persica]|uniref:MFS transporter n=1 Tax=Fontisphaera persica TaxID=2974023 RepID=UPI0024C02A89|nr:MFS transporter [Fontisphaera persica]WCJ60268.1 MFS transporter [Fontisphaera persica]